MSNNSSKNEIRINDPYTLKKAYQILNKEITIFDQDKKFYNYKYEFVSDVNILNYKKKKVKLLRNLSLQMLKKPLTEFNLKRALEKNIFQGSRNLPKSYKILTYSFFLLIKMNLSEGFQKLRGFSKLENIDELYYSKTFYPKLLKTNLRIAKLYNRTLNQSIAISSYGSRLFYKKVLNFMRIVFGNDNKKYTNIPSYSLFKSCYSFDKNLIQRWIYINQVVNNKKNLLLENNNIFLLKNKIFSRFSIFNTLFNYLKTIKEFIYSIEEKHVKAVGKRILEVFCLYFIPFIFLSTQAFVPLMEEYEYIIVNPFANFFIGAIPFLPELIKLLRPIIKNPLLLFWAPLAYLLVFPLNYKSLKIPYKLAFNGTVALVFLIINYSCVLMQFLLRIVFESSKIVKDIFFTSYLIKHLGKSKLKKDKDQVIKLFSNLVTRYDVNMQKSYYEFLLLINHRFFSYLALISLASLLYNCTYYVIHNKNPEMIIITKAVLGTIKNPQDGKE